MRWCISQVEESFGLVVAESLARGCKLFGARAGGIVDITGGVAGAELFDVDDWDGLVDGAIPAWIRRGYCAGRTAARGLMRDRYSPTVDCAAASGNLPGSAEQWKIAAGNKLSVTSGIWIWPAHIPNVPRP